VKNVSMCLLLAVAVTVIAPAASAQPDRLGICEVDAFTVPPEVNLPDQFRSALASNLVEHLRDTGRFTEVVTRTAGSGANHPAVRLTGTVTQFKKGSQAKRYLLGPGFGKTILKAHIRFVEADSGKLLLERDVDGKVIIGLLGGDSKGATNGLAKEVAKVAKKSL
jgi:hypothetical protein